MSKLTVVVTGAHGVIGQAVVQHLMDEGHAVVALDVAPESKYTPRTPDEKSRFTYKSVHVDDYDAFLAAVKDINATGMIHLAAMFSIKNPADPDGPLLRYVPQHIMHNMNVAMSWNALSVAAELGIKRLSLASSVNAIGLIFSKRPQFDYLPMDEKHPCYPEDAYSMCKLEMEKQCDAFARANPDMRLATLRPHWVIPDTLAYDPEALHAAGGTAKDLWGWVSLSAVARAFVLGLTAPETTFPLGHETFFLVAPTIALQTSSMEMLAKTFPEAKTFTREIKGNDGFYDCSKAERMLGWTERAFPWSPK